MRILLAFALVSAVATSPKPEAVELGAAPEPEVVHEDPLSAISFLPLFVPSDIVKAFEEDFANNPPLEAYYEGEIVPEPIQLAEVPEEELNNAFVHPLAYGGFEAPADNAFEVSNIQIAEPNNEVAEEIKPNPIRIIYPQNADEIAPTPIKIVELPQNSVFAEEIAPSPIQLVESGDDASVPYNAEAVEIFAPVYQDPQYAYPPKMYDNPMLR